MAVNASLVGKAATATNTVTTAAGATTTGDTLVLSVSYDPGTTISSVTDLDAGNTFTLKTNYTAGAAKLAIYVCENATGHAAHRVRVNFSGTAFPSAALTKVTGAAAASYDAGSLATATDSTPPNIDGPTTGTLAQAASVVLAFAEINRAGGTGAYASSNFTVIGSENDASNFWTHAVAKLVVAATTPVTPLWTKDSSSGTNGLIAVAFKEAVAGGGTITTLTVTDFIVMIDQNTFWRMRRRQGDDTTLIIDVAVSGARRGVTATEGVTLTDLLNARSQRRREGSDGIVTFDQITNQWAHRRREGSEAVVPTDGFYDWIHRRRTATDSLETIDGFIKAIVGAGAIYVQVLSDTLITLDDAGNRWTRRLSRLTDGLEVSDPVAYWAQRMRLFSDAFVFSDGELHIRQLGRMLQDGALLADGELHRRTLGRTAEDNLIFTDGQGNEFQRLQRTAQDDIAVLDELLKVFFSSSHYDVDIRIGMQPSAVLGSRDLNTLGIAKDVPTLGGIQ